MTEIPQTRYAKAPDGTSIAYQVVGDGPVDLVYATGIWSNVEIMWEHPFWAHFLKRLARFSRLILEPRTEVLRRLRQRFSAVRDMSLADELAVDRGAEALRESRE